MSINCIDSNLYPCTVLKLPLGAVSPFRLSRCSGSHDATLSSDIQNPTQFPAFPISFSPHNETNTRSTKMSLPDFWSRASTPDYWIRVSTPEYRSWRTPQTKISTLQLTTSPLPTPTPSQVLVKVSAISLNYRDVQVCRGHYASASSRSFLTPTTPDLVPCSDMCGVIVHSETKHLPQGTRVVALVHQSYIKGSMTQRDADSTLGFPLEGVLAEYVLLPAASVVKVPEYLTDEEAACLPLAALTAWNSLDSLSPKSVLLQGTGPAALAGLQIAKARDFKAIVTVPSEDHKKKAEEMGADAVINHQTHWEWQDAVLEATEGNGADVVLETGSARTLRKSFACVAFGGEIHALGFAATTDDDQENDGEKGSTKTPGLHRLNVGGLAIKRNVTLKAVVGGSRDDLEKMLRFYEKKEIRPVVNKVFGFEQAKEALEYVDTNEGFGKVVIKIEDKKDENEGDGDKDKDGDREKK